MKFVLLSKTSKDKSTEILPPLLLIPTYTCARALPRAIKRSAKGSNFKKRRQGFAPLEVTVLLYGLYKPLSTHLPIGPCPRETPCSTRLPRK